MNRGQVLLPGEAELGELLEQGTGPPAWRGRTGRRTVENRGQVLLPGEAELAGELLDQGPGPPTWRGRTGRRTA